MLSYTPLATGPLSIRAAHDPTPQLGGLAARATTIDVLPRRVLPRSGRTSIRALQRRLARLGYVIGQPRRLRRAHRAAPCSPFAR